MNVFAWLSNLFSNQKQPNETQAQLDLLASEIITLKKAVEDIQLNTASLQWAEASSEVILNLDKKVEDVALVLETYQNFFQQMIDEEEEKVTVSRWGLIRNTKDSN